VIASGNFDGGAKSAAKGAALETRVEQKQPGWTKLKEKELHELIAAARKQKPRPLDMPDRLVVWYSDKDGGWHLNVWVHFDTQGKVRTGRSSRLRPKESSEKLFDRVREATTGAPARE
jgi:hypothetical protein